MSTIISIQGARGSFNEEAAKELVSQEAIANPVLRYSHTTRRVFEDLASGRALYGVFALYNSRSLLVEETAAVLGHVPFDIVNSITLPIRHCVLVHPEVSCDHLTQIVGHPEALRQCRDTLRRTFASVPHRALSEEDFSDGAAVAAALAAGDERISPTTAVLGSRAIAAAYDFTICAQDIHDDPSNATTFLLVRRYPSE